MTGFTLGCDPELFLKRDGLPISGHDIIPGTKDKPSPVEGGAIQADGTAAEFNTDPIPLEGTSQNFIKGVGTVVKQLSKVATAAGAQLSFTPVQEYPEEYIKSLPKIAVELGCDPDYSAYTGEVNPRPNGEVNFRTGSGHLHFGWVKDVPPLHPEHFQICCDFVKILDRFIGLYMTIIDSDDRRRSLYGKAGAFRPKSYGVEYRTPSNAWVKDNSTRAAIFELSKLAVEYFKVINGDIRRAMGSSDIIRDTVDTGNYSRAKDYLDSFLAGRASLSLRRHVSTMYNRRVSAEKTEGVAA